MSSIVMISSGLPGPTQTRKIPLFFIKYSTVQLLAFGGLSIWGSNLGIQ